MDIAHQAGRLLDDIEVLSLDVGKLCAEVRRLRAVNADLVTALTAARDHVDAIGEDRVLIKPIFTLQLIDAALEKAEGR